MKRHSLIIVAVLSLTVCVSLALAKEDPIKGSTETYNLSEVAGNEKPQIVNWHIPSNEIFEGLWDPDRSSSVSNEAPNSSVSNEYDPNRHNEVPRVPSQPSTPVKYPNGPQLTPPNTPPPFTPVPPPQTGPGTGTPESGKVGIWSSIWKMMLPGN